VHHDRFQAGPLRSRIECEPYVSRSSYSAEQDLDAGTSPSHDKHN
jgi:hypothetical protein